MLTEICQYLKNWFDRGQPKFYGQITLSDDEIIFDGLSIGDFVKNGQYIRIVGSALNDGVYQFPVQGTMDETFDGAVWAMAIPPAVVRLANEIKEWSTKYGTVEAPAMSPYNSESFGGYSYSKGAGTETSWQSVFASRLAQWRIIK